MLRPNRPARPRPGPPARQARAEGGLCAAPPKASPPRPSPARLTGASGERGQAPARPDRSGSVGGEEAEAGPGEDDDDDDEIWRMAYRIR